MNKKLLLVNCKSLQYWADFSDALFKGCATLQQLTAALEGQYHP